MSSTKNTTPVLRVPKATPLATTDAEIAYQRITSIDLLRGLVMVVMALDHTRDFFSNAFFSPLDLTQTTTPLFFTRWITHFCAPVFILLAGAGAYLYGSRGRTNLEVARFLFKRGLFLIVLEFTLVHFGWFFSFDYHFLLAQVMWAIGWSMTGVAGLVALRVPLWALAAFGMIMIAGHNLFNNVNADAFGKFRWIWIILHQPDIIGFAPGRQLDAFYSLVPWVGVMAVGYSLGPILLKSPDERRKWLLGLGIVVTFAFIIFRWINIYGDPQRWTPQSSSWFTFLSFINTSKYPPSLLFLLMTLGPALLFLSVFDRVNSNNPIARVFTIFGRVPLFYYVLHLSLIHAVAVVFSYIRYGEASWLFGTDWMFRMNLPRGYGYGLPIVYTVWISVVILLYPVCYWLARFKQNWYAWWLSYI